jgi:hypothetical protein
VLKDRPDQELASKFATPHPRIPTSALSTHRLSPIALRDLALDGLDRYLRRKQRFGLRRRELPLCLVPRRALAGLWDTPFV